MELFDDKGNFSPVLLSAISDLYIQFCRLKGYKPPKNGLEKMIDEATGYEDAHMKEFADWFVNDLLPRIAVQPNNPRSSDAG